MLLPAFAELIGYPLHEYGISIVNIGNTAFERYIKLFSRRGDDRIELPVSIVTDVDVRPLEYYNDKGTTGKVYVIESQNEFQQILSELGLESDLTDEDRPYGTIFSTIKKLKDGFEISETSDENKLDEKVAKVLTKDYINRLIGEKRIILYKSTKTIMQILKHLSHQHGR